MESCKGYPARMTDAQTAFWTAIVQIIPVILLALVVEARAMRVDRKRIKRLVKDARAKHPNSRVAQLLRIAWTTSWDRAYLATSVMLATSLLLLGTELVGLSSIYMDAAPPQFVTVLAFAGIVAGLVVAALSPVFGGFLLALEETTPTLPKDLRHQPGRS